jgi:HAD superfamily hydrolase (TIGR01509 family)
MAAPYTRPTAILFDMDGVLVDSEQYWYESRVEWAASLGKAWTMGDQRHAMGRNTLEWAAVMRERLALGDAFTHEAIAEAVRSRVIARLHARLPLLPGAVEAVHAAAEAGPVALASGSPTAVIETVMALSGLDQVFQVMVFGDTIAHGKPAPDIYLEAARRLGAEPASCVGIEDSGNGLRSLVNAGMGAIAVPSPGFPLAPDVLALADRVLASLTAFTPALAADIAAERAARG